MNFWARPTTKKKKNQRVEDGVQAKFITELEQRLKPDHHVYAIPNGGFRLMTEAIRLKAGGVKKGPTDLFILAPDGVVAWLETKTTAKGSSLSDEQKGFRAICLRNGHLWGMYRTIEEGLEQAQAWGFLKERRP